tara:strand:- start:327 stop:542 length:216 start_codon:yes stop_codon:yes gene_type:complete
MKIAIALTTVLCLLTSCSQFAFIASGSSLVISQNVYSKAYNGVNLITVIGTEKDIKTHIIEKIKKEKGKEK